MMSSDQGLLGVPAALGSRMCSSTGQCPLCQPQDSVYCLFSAETCALLFFRGGTWERTDFAVTKSLKCKEGGGD